MPMSTVQHITDGLWVLRNASSRTSELFQVHTENVQTVGLVYE